MFINPFLRKVRVIFVFYYGGLKTSHNQLILSEIKFSTTFFIITSLFYL